MNSDHHNGFSLPEVLIGVVLLSITVSTMLRYQKALSEGFQTQWQHQQLWQALWQNVQGHSVSDWQIKLQKRIGPEGCELRQASTEWRGKMYHLNWLICSQNLT